jgi:hypothetical protein
VRGLDVDQDDVERARQHIQSQGVYGPVSVMQWNADWLPYADNLARLLVVSNAGQVSADENNRPRP